MTRRLRRRDLLIGVAAELLLPTPASAASLVSSAFGYTVASSAVNTTGATLIVIYSGRSGVAPQTPTDNAGNTYTGLTVVVAGSLYTQFFYKVNPTTSASHTFTPGNASVICVGAFSGAAGHDSGGTNTNFGELSSTATNALDPLTPTASGDLIVTGFGTFFNDAAASVVDDDAAGDPAVVYSDNRSGYTQKLFWKTYNSTSPLTITWTGTISNTNSESQAAFLASAGAPAALPRRRPVSL